MDRKIVVMVPKPLPVASPPLTAVFVAAPPDTAAVPQTSRSNSAAEKRLDEENGARAAEFAEAAS